MGVDVGLKYFERNGVSIFVLTILSPLFLKTTICKMNKIILPRKLIIRTRRPYIPLPIKQHIPLPSHSNLQPYIKLPIMIQQRPLYILLHNPFRVRISRRNTLLNLLNRPQNLNPPALVQRRWFQDPHIRLTMLLRHLVPLCLIFSIPDRLKNSSEILVILVTKIRVNHECDWNRVCGLVASGERIGVSSVILFQGTYEACFSRDFSHVGKVVDDTGARVVAEQAVRESVEAGGFPDKICLFESFVLICDLE